MQPPGSLLSPSSKNIKKIHPKKISYTPGKVELSNLKKNFQSFKKQKLHKKLYFLKRKLFFYFGKQKPHKNSKEPKTKISYISPKIFMNQFF